MCDDLRARKTARELGAVVIGTLGLIIKVSRQGSMTFDAALRLIRLIPERTTLHIARNLIEEAAQEIESAVKAQCSALD